MSAQPYCKTITGNVYDSIGNPLPGAIVQIRNSGWFSLVKTGGRFLLSVCPLDSADSSIQLSVSYIGYHNFDTVLIADTTSVRLGNIRLKSSAAVLNDVLVTAQPIEKRGDTTAFNIASFKAKTDVNLEDLIRRLPGFDIDGNGAIRYNNKPIENILIEGDAMADNYKLLSKNLSPDIIDKLELVDHYQENPQLKNIVSSSQQVINLRLKKNAGSQLFGQAKISGGIVESIRLRLMRC